MSQTIFDFLHSLAHKSTFFDLLWIFFAEYLPIIIAVLFLILVFQEKDRRKRFYFLALATLSVILAFGIVSPIFRFFYESPRPFMALDIIPLVDQPPSNSLPSNHMMVFTPIAFAIYHINKRLGWYAIGGIVLMGISRVITGLHWPLDILFGLVLAVLSFYFVRYLLAARGVK